MNSTINFYNKNAQDYFNQTISFKNNDIRDSFEKTLKQKSNILDIGCGSGRDSLYFLNKNHKVVAIDASKDLAKIASNILGQEVVVQKVQDINYKNEFDAVWASASLLHITKEELIVVLNKIYESLKDNESKFYASFKLGSGSGLDNQDRFFQYYEKDEIINLLKENNLFDNIQYSINEDNMGRSDTKWISIISNKKIKYENKVKIL